MKKPLYVVWTSQFKREYKIAKKRGLKMALLNEIVEKLANHEDLPPNNRDHALTGSYRGFRECHIQPDWLLIYKIEDDILVLTLSRTGSHTDLFD